jgi:hypothetical protein
MHIAELTDNINRRDGSRKKSRKLSLISLECMNMQESGDKPTPRVLLPHTVTATCCISHAPQSFSSFLGKVGTCTWTFLIGRIQSRCSGKQHVTNTEILMVRRDGPLSIALVAKKMQLPMGSASGSTLEVAYARAKLYPSSAPDRVCRQDLKSRQPEDRIVRASCLRSYSALHRVKPGFACSCHQRCCKESTNLHSLAYHVALSPCAAVPRGTKRPAFNNPAACSSTPRGERTAPLWRAKRLIPDCVYSLMLMRLGPLPRTRWV